MNNDLIHIYLDRSYSQTIPDNLKNEIDVQTSDMELEKSKISFCGFLFKGKDTYVFMPRGSNIEKAALSKTELARLLFECLKKYCRTNETFLQKEGKSTVVGNPQILPLIDEILNDYKANGIYTSESSFARRGFQGKTDWKKTLGTVNPVLQEGEVIYPHFINRFTNSFFSNEVTKIHNSILKAIQVRFGWLFPDLESFSFGQFTRTDSRSVNIRVLKSELMRVYSDSKIHTLKILLRFLEDDFNSGKAESVTYGFRDFQYVWEHMLKSVLSPIHTFVDMPVPTYIDKSGREWPKEQKSQRIDIILYKPEAKEACVIDAKYYDGSSVHNAPGWPDLVKQFFYAKSLSAGNLIDQVTLVKNYFIFPGASGSNSPDEIFVRDSSGHLNHVFPPIKCKHVSPESIIKSYISNKQLIDLREDLFK